MGGRATRASTFLTANLPLENRYGRLLRDAAGVPLRVVETAHEIRGDPLASYRAPIDAVHVASWTGAAGGSGSIGAGSAFEAFRQMCVAPSELDGDEDEETDSET